MRRRAPFNMITQFHLVDREGNIVARGEIDGDIYRLFDDAFVGGNYTEFMDTTDLFSVYEGCAIQPEMFQTPADTRQLSLLTEKSDKV